MRLPVNQIASRAVLSLLSASLLSGCVSAGGGDAPHQAPLATSGPAADYPVVIGEPFEVGNVTYTPVDRLNYDAVGYAAIGAGGEGVSGAHKTMPLPSYVEVTALDTGKTALVRLERRGPMINDRLVELSPGAAAQLGLTADKSPVRVRRVNPPEPERALLRVGQRAPDRMDTPKSLLAVLMRKIDPAAPVILSSASPAPVAGRAVPTAAPKPMGKPASTTPKIEPQPVVAPAPTARPAPAPAQPAARPAAQGGLVVQIGAFSSKANAEASAAKTGGQVMPTGRLFRVRSGPFATRAAAEAALAKVRAAGYSDARIQRAD